MSYQLTECKMTQYLCNYVAAYWVDNIDLLWMLYYKDFNQYKWGHKSCQYIPNILCAYVPVLTARFELKVDSIQGYFVESV